MIDYKNLADVALTNATPLDLFTLPAGEKCLIYSCVVTNTTAGVLAITLTATARTGGTARTLIDGRNIPAHGSELCPEAVNVVLEAGGKLTLTGDSGIHAMVSGPIIV